VPKIEVPTTSSFLSADVVVVGAGPAGCTAAKTAAELGANVILLEEHSLPGLPVFCGEAISHETLVAAGLKPEPPIVNEPIRKANIYAPNGKHVTISTDKVLGYTINRDIFDGLLADKAVAAGVTLMVNAKAREVTKKNGVVVGVKAQCHGETLNIKSKIVIGADGHASIVRQSALGIPYFKSFTVCAQYTLNGLNIQEPDAVEVWFGRKYAPGGYAWVFPKSRTMANVGIGVRANQATKPAILYLKDFISQNPDLRDGTIIHRTGGICPSTGTLDKIVDDGVMLVGDAAGQTIPMTGAGVESAIHAGKMAGRVASKAIQEGDTSKLRLEEYPETYYRHWGKLMENSKRTLKIFDALNDEDLNKVSEIITPEQVRSLAYGEIVLRNLVPIAFKAPRLALKILRASS
jgi:digeranylgeranylglycerophospholipid reductase